LVTKCARRFTPGGFFFGGDSSLSEKSEADVEAEGDHAEGGEQADAAKERDDFERMGICLGFGGIPHKHACNNRIHLTFVSECFRGAMKMVLLEPGNCFIAGRRELRGPLRARPITVEGVGDEYAGAHDAEERSERFQHDNNPIAPAGRT
jgi:hypothetical protein